MRNEFVQRLMADFAESTGITGNAPPRRYLWTDAFAVCNFLGLYRETGEDRYLEFALELVHQVHHILGRHRNDDPRSGWISGLPDSQAERHPTIGGLRIGKKLNERGVGEPPDSRLEWEQDGQYFHYLTKWMHALYRVSQETDEDRYLRWATELAATAHKAFTYETTPGGAKRMVWKMSIDLSRPLVSSMGQHDPLDGATTYLELQTSERFPAHSEIDLAHAIADMTKMCAQGTWTSADPLGIGGLLEAAVRLAQMVFGRGVECRDLLVRLLRETASSLQAFAYASSLNDSAERRLAFREFGLSIGLRALEWIAGLVSRDRELAGLVKSLLPFRALADQIEAFWSQPDARESLTWIDHRDINTVMFATSQAPEGYLKL